MVAKKNYADMKGQGVLNALGSVTISKAMEQYFVNKQEDWKFFGKMNSHLYRQILFNKMEDKKLSAEAIMMVYAMASVIKSQPRIVQAMRDMPDAEKFTSEGVWYAVRSFFETDCTQYVTAAKRENKFPVVNIPGTMPGLDILWFCLTTPDEDRTMDNLKVRPTFTQISLQADVQTVAREGYEHYWDNVVKGSKNPDNKAGVVEAPMMRQEYYETQAADMYNLITYDKGMTLTLLIPSHTSGKYSMEEVQAYLRSFDKPAAT
jgi:hypothetical protein